MSGYDLERFVDLSAKERHELTCSICQDIFRNPVVTNCCLQTFCEQCITDWIKTNKTCPFDRKPLNKHLLTRPPRVLTNLLGELKIKCDFREKGCLEVISLEQLENHLIICRFNDININKCDKCNCDLTIDHNCLKSLLKVIDEKNKLNIELNEKLESERQEWINTIKNIKQTSHSLNLSSDSISVEQILNEAQEFISQPIVILKNTTEEVTNKIIRAVKQEIIFHDNCLSLVCKKISKKLNEEFDFKWHCIAIHNQSENFANYFFEFEPQFRIELKFGNLLFNIYKLEKVS